MATTSQSKTFVVRPKISLTDQDPTTRALGVYKISKFSGCPDTYYPTKDRVLGRYLTGLDDTHPDVLSLPQAERKAKQDEILEEKGFLEKELGINLHHTNEDFWSSLDIRIDIGRVFSTSVPLDRVILSAIKAGSILPMSKDECDDPIFKGVNFYIGQEYEDVEDKNKVRAREREVFFKLKDLLDNFDYAVEVGKYLGIDGISEKTPRANLDDLISSYLEKKEANKDTFLDVMSQPRQFVQLSNKFKTLKQKRLVDYSNGKWYSGKVALGKTEKDSVKKLLSSNPEMQAELARLMEELDEK